MFPILINPLTTLLTLSTAFGVLVHDIKLDQVAVVAALPITVVVSYGAVDYGLKLDDHIHIEKSNIDVGGSQPATQPRNDDKKYSAQKKLTLNISGSEYQWPSV